MAPQRWKLCGSSEYSTMDTYLSFVKSLGDEITVANVRNGLHLIIAKLKAAEATDRVPRRGPLLPSHTS